MASVFSCDICGKPCEAEGWKTATVNLPAVPGGQFPVLKTRCDVIVTVTKASIGAKPIINKPELCRSCQGKLVAAAAVVFASLPEFP